MSAPSLNTTDHWAPRLHSTSVTRKSKVENQRKDGWDLQNRLCDFNWSECQFRVAKILHFPGEAFELPKYGFPPKFLGHHLDSKNSHFRWLHLFVISRNSVISRSVVEKMIEARTVRHRSEVSGSARQCPAQTSADPYYRVLTSSKTGQARILVEKVYNTNVMISTSMMPRSRHLILYCF